MKKNILILTAIVSIFSACSKNNSDNPPPPVPTGEYQPLTAGSSWTYSNEIITGPTPAPSTAVTTMTATKKVFDGRTFYLANTVDGGVNYELYLGVNNHVYTSRRTSGTTTVEVNYLDDSKAQGYSTTVALQTPGVDSRLKTTVVEKGISKTILTKAYNNVIHTKLETQVKDGTEYKTTTAVDFYVAKGVGIIAVYTTLNGAPTTKSELKSYIIK